MQTIPIKVAENGGSVPMEVSGGEQAVALGEVGGEGKSAVLLRAKHHITLTHFSIYA